MKLYTYKQDGNPLTNFFRIAIFNVSEACGLKLRSILSGSRYKYSCGCVSLSDRGNFCLPSPIVSVFLMCFVSSLFFINPKITTVN